MRIATIQTISPDGPIRSLPITLHQKSSQWSMIADGFFLAVTGLAFSLPAGLFAAEALATETLSTAGITAQPIPAMLTLFGLFLLFIPVACLLRRLLTGHGGSRQIAMTWQDVTVTDRTLLGQRTRSEPMTAYAGLTHHIRTTLSHPRHELILVHPDRSQSILLRMADKIDESEISELAKCLGKPVLPATCLYRLPGLG